MLASTAASGPKGTTAQAASAGMMVMTGPRKNRPLCAAAGLMISLKISLTAIGDGRQQATRGRRDVRAWADLRPADGLALPQRQVGHGQIISGATTAMIFSRLQTRGHRPPSKATHRFARGRVDHVLSDAPSDLAQRPALPKAAPNAAVCAMTGRARGPRRRADPLPGARAAWAAPPSCTMRTRSPSCSHASCCQSASRQADRFWRLRDRRRTVNCSEGRVAQVHRSRRSG